MAERQGPGSDTSRQALELPVRIEPVAQGATPPAAALIPFTLLVLAIWLLVGSWLLGYPFTEGAMDAKLQETGVGIVVGVLAVVRLRGHLHRTLATVFMLPFGLWLAVAPFILGYGQSGPGTVARVHGVLAGVVVIALAAVDLALPPNWRAPAAPARRESEGRA